MRLARHGVEFEIIQGDFAEESASGCDRGSCSAQAHRFDAVFAANDNMAIGALQALRARRNSACRTRSPSRVSTTFRWRDTSG